MSRPNDIGLTFIKILHLQRLFGIYGFSPIRDNLRAQDEFAVMISDIFIILNIF